MEVDGFHTYHIGTLGVWVHNHICLKGRLQKYKDYVIDSTKKGKTPQDLGGWVRANKGKEWSPLRGAGSSGFPDFIQKTERAGKIHKNSLDYVGPAHVYRIDGPNGLEKVGESARGTIKGANGEVLSIRALEQTKAFAYDTGQIYHQKILKNFENKKDAVTYQTQLIERYRPAINIWKPKPARLLISCLKI